MRQHLRYFALVLFFSLFAVFKFRGIIYIFENYGPQWGFPVVLGFLVFLLGTLTWIRVCNAEGNIDERRVEEFWHDLWE